MNLPELAERDAAAEKAAIYAEIRRLGGVPMVALIFRHLATVPGALEWLWAAIAPVWRSGRLQETAWRIARDAPLSPMAPFPREALAVLGVDADGEAEIRAVLAAYNRANPENLLTVLCLARLLDGYRGKSRAAPRAWVPPAPVGPLVPMMALEAMPRAITDLLVLVAAPDEAGGPRVVQSLYRHLGGRPGFLALAVAMLLPRLRDGSVERGAAAIHAEMGRAADELVEGLSAPVVPDPRVRPALRRFGGVVIPQMIAAGRLLEGAMPPVETAAGA